jgi:hypothetical protein
VGKVTEAADVLPSPGLAWGSDHNPKYVLMADATALVLPIVARRCPLDRRDFDRRTLRGSAMTRCSGDLAAPCRTTGSLLRSFAPKKQRGERPALWLAIHATKNKTRPGHC